MRTLITVRKAIWLIWLCCNLSLLVMEKNAAAVGAPRNGRPKLYEKVLPEKKSEADPCDCPYAHCPGCWYACRMCGSNKCSPFCRVNRKQSLEWKKSD